MRRLPNLSALRAFDAAARQESFVRAGDELGLTPAAISQHVRNLEMELGIALFDRGHKSISLTEDGRRYAEQVATGFAHLMPQRSSNGTLEPTVVLDADAEFLRQWLLPRMTANIVNDIGVHLLIRPRNNYPRMLPGDTDIAITLGSIDHHGYRRDHLLSPIVFGVASPALNVRSMKDVSGQRLLHDRNDAWWRKLFESAGIDYPSPVLEMTFDQCDFSIFAACQGLGVAVGDDLMSSPYLNSGQLIRIDGPVLKSRSFCLHSRKVGPSVRARRIADWIRSEAERFTRQQDGLLSADAGPVIAG